MKKGWRIALIADGVLAALSAAAAIWFNSRPSVGMAALEDMGRFVVSFVIFIASLIVFSVLATVMLILYIRRR